MELPGNTDSLDSIVASNSEPVAIVSVVYYVLITIAVSGKAAAKRQVRFHCFQNRHC